MFAVRVGAEGIPNTLTLCVPGKLVHPATVAVTEYMPVARVEAPTMVVFCDVEVNAFGPVQLKVAPPGLVEVRLIVPPVQRVEVPPAVGAAGVGFTITATVPAGLLHPKEFTVKEYVPPAAVVAATKEGF